MATQKSFDFGKMKRSFCTTKLKDGQTIIVNMPKKSTFEKLMELDEANEEDGSNGDAFSRIAEIIAEILSNNKNKVEISPEDIAGNYDLEEMLEYIKLYMEFVNSIKTDPN